MTAYRPKAVPGKPTILSGSLRYGVSRHCDARDARGNPVKVAIVVIERDNGAAGTSFDTLAIPESKIRFAGEGIVESEVRRAVGL